MSRLVVKCFSVSLDGYGAGPDQSLNDPMGKGGMALHGWVLKTQSFHAQHGTGQGGDTGVDNDFAEGGMQNLGAWVLGRNMFGPVRGPWPDEAWRGWWGDNPVYHCPVFVLTHHPRPDLVMEGGTVFHFVTEGLDVAVARAKAAAGGRDVRLGGGAATLRQGFACGLIDHAHFAVSPVLLGQGEPVFAGLDLPALGYRVTRHVATDAATHVVIDRV
jgi:dihydrofolate reductase